MPKRKLVRRGFEDPMSIVDEPSGWEHKFNYGNLRMYNNRHLKEHRRITRHFKDKTYIHNYGVKPTSIEQVDGIEEEIPEMVPEIGKWVFHKVLTKVALLQIKGFYLPILGNHPK